MCDIQIRRIDDSAVSGLNLAQLSTVFPRYGHRRLAEMLKNVKPSGRRNGVDVWRLGDVSHYVNVINVKIEKGHACCENETRGMRGGCENCGDPSF